MTPEDDQRVLAGRIGVQDAARAAAPGPEAVRAAAGVREVAAVVGEDERTTRMVTWTGWNEPNPAGSGPISTRSTQPSAITSARLMS
ncbi:MAG TPA: hypothetical protein VFH48_22240 [Chloroflexota bacterium]|nr:hypothetical protein [Chloroflexota bacterium]